ncbi:hypothetical protein RND81_11G103200 [Saponaria officinalis]|uniref:Retrotransposon gag domain-containing protein n=1 Tax=Saponaria officinalis TaxID=3572 RepID=A0AAW1HKR4_SAPOF
MSGRGRGRGRANYNNNINENNNNNDLAAAVQQLVVMNQNLIQVVTQLTQAGNPNVASDMTKSVSLQRPSYFDGKGDPVKLEAWVRSFDKIFATLNCPENLKIAQATHYLTENADIWWTENKDRLMAPRPHVDEGVEVIRVMNWEEFKTSLRTEFFPEHLKRGKRAEFNNLKQGTLSVQEYYNQFQELARFAFELVPIPESRASRFEQGLDIEIRAGLGGWNYEIILEVYTRASNIERVLNERRALVGEKRKANPVSGEQGVTKKPFYGNQGRTSNPTNSQPSQNTGFSSQSVCRKCGHSHIGRDCNGRLWVCHYCNKMVHRAPECRSRIKDQENQQGYQTRSAQSAGVRSVANSTPNRGFQGGNRFNNKQTQTNTNKSGVSGATTGAAKTNGQINAVILEETTFKKAGTYYFV